MDVLEELAKHAPSFIWGALAFFVVFVFRKPIVSELLPRLSGVSVGGVEMSFVERSMAEAAGAANRSNMVASTVEKRHVEVTKRDRECALERLTRAAHLLKGRRILWLDDSVANNRLERDLLTTFGVKIEQVQDNDAAFGALEPDGGGYDLILSDIDRPKGEPTGLDFLERYRGRGWGIPVIFYISMVDEEEPVPLGAFGLTNRPDELVHLVIDALARRP